MSDDLLERRLQAALRHEADGLPFTITEAELQRRLALRRRTRGIRAPGLLIAAALAIGVVGIGAIAGAWLERRDPTIATPLPSRFAQASPGTPSPSNLILPVTLPTIDQLIADGGGEDHLALGQSNGPSEGPSVEPNQVDLGAPSLSFGPDVPPGNYRITFACLGPAHAGVEVRGTSSLGGILVPTIACDGQVVTSAAHLNDPGIVRLVVDQRASWRVAVHRIGDPVPMASGAHDVPESAPDEGEFLARADLPPSDGPAGELVDVGIPTRESYIVQVSCSDAPTVRYGFGEETEGARSMSTITIVPCDGSVHTARYAIGELLGSRLFVDQGAASSSLMVRSDPIPIAVASDRPGWQMSSAMGPTYVSRADAQGTSLFAHEKRGPVLVVIGCAGMGPITGTIDVGTVEGQHVIPFDATCTPEGAEFEHSYVVDGPNVTVYYTAPIRSYVVVSALEPKPSS